MKDDCIWSLVQSKELKGLKELEVESGFENEADDELVRRALTSLYHGFR